MEQLSPAKRQRAVIDAKKQLVEQYRAKLADPEFAKRQEARRATVAAREARIAERKTAEQARITREAAEKAAQEAAEERHAKLRFKLNSPPDKPLQRPRRPESGSFKRRC